MYRWLIILLFFFSCVAVVSAQQDEDKIACHAFPKTTESYKKKLWDGYEISLGPARNAAETDGGDCTAAIYNRAGKVVFRTTGFGVIFDEKHTGMDFDGDGKGEVVFMTDVAGGAHCCWVYNIVTLLPKPHRLFDVGEGAAVDFVKDEQGMVIWERIGGPTGYTSMAQRPYAERANRVKDGKLVDSTPEFSKKLFSAGAEDYDEWTRTLTPENIKKLPMLKDFGSKADEDTDEIVSALLSRALQRVLCHQYEQAEADLNLWPESTRDDMKEEFAVSVKEFSPEFAARLAGVNPTSR